MRQLVTRLVGLIRSRTGARGSYIPPTPRVAANTSLSVTPSTAPSGPTSGWIIYCDSSDGKLKAKASTGTVVTLGTP